eukprot:4406630-Pleurochrysis_carterae.AAC.1
MRSPSDEVLSDACMGDGPDRGCLPESPSASSGDPSGSGSAKPVDSASPDDDFGESAVVTCGDVAIGVPSSPDELDAAAASSESRMESTQRWERDVSSHGHRPGSATPSPIALHDPRVAENRPWPA